MQAKDILETASITLLDQYHTRWPLTELLSYLNKGLKALALDKPNAVTETVDLPLAAGTVQDLTAISPDYISLIRVLRNKNGRAVTAVSRTMLDVVMPGWQDPNVWPASAVVDHVIQDVADPRSFLVAPANDGTGIIEAVVSILPTPIPAATDPADIATYTQTVPVPAIFENALVDYVLYRAYAKDADDPANATRAQAHYGMYAAQIGKKLATDQATTTKTTGASA